MSSTELPSQQLAAFKQESAGKKLKEHALSAGLLTIACAAQLIGADQSAIHSLSIGLNKGPIEDSSSKNPAPNTTFGILPQMQDEIRMSENSKKKLTLQHVKNAGITASALVYGAYYFGEDGMAVATNAASVNLLHGAVDGTAGRMAAAGMTAAAVTGWNYAALHYNEGLLRKVLRKKTPSKYIESSRPIVSQLGLTSTNIGDMFTTDLAESEEKNPNVLVRAKNKVMDHAKRMSMLKTSIVGAPVGFNDELLNKGLDIRTMRRREIELLIAKHSALFGATWGVAAASRGLGPVNSALEVILTPENLVLGLGYIYGNKITKELFSKRIPRECSLTNTASFEGTHQEMISSHTAPIPTSSATLIDFEDDVVERLVVKPDGNLHSIYATRHDAQREVE